MEEKITPQQRAAIESEGKVIVSASAGSGKTFVMIERLTRYIQSGGDLEGVLAVTFTKKAAAQMKEKLRSSLIKRSADCPPRQRAHIKEQLSKIASANISTIHSFCAYLLRVHFYLLDIDGSFDIVSEDGGSQISLRARAMDSLFERLYEEGDKDLLHLAARYTHKRSDSRLKSLISSAYDAVRNYPDYAEMLKTAADMPDSTAFKGVCADIMRLIGKQCAALCDEFNEFMRDFNQSPYAVKYAAYAENVRSAIFACADGDLFDPFPEFKRMFAAPKDEGMAVVHAAFVKEREEVKRCLKKMKDGLKDRDTEYAMFCESRQTSAAFTNLLIKFDGEYAAVKRDEGKLDYSDLEHLTLRLLADEGVLKEVRERFSRVFVDEYQDVNPVQERIISLVGGENLFLVGDVKQAIYGFRGSKSSYFTDKIAEFCGKGKSLGLTGNFRSAPAVLNSVNKAFSLLMRPETCGINYSADGVMTAGAAYPKDSGGATIHYFGVDERENIKPDGVYSPEEVGGGYSREGLAVLSVVREELASTFYDIEAGEERSVTFGDICVLVRKKNDSAAGILRALTAAGYPVTAVQSDDAYDYPEVRQMLDILSYIDNGEQDIPLASAMLSPVGGFSEGELAAIRMCAGTSEKKLIREKTFRECCRIYIDDKEEIKNKRNEKFYDKQIAAKICAFNGKIEGYRGLACLFGAGTVIDKILADTGLEARYIAGGGKRLKNLRRLADSARTPSGELSVAEFLRRQRAGGKLNAAAGTGGDSIKIMTMHASKGLEFPIVIMADINRPYRGQEDGSLSLSQKYGFAHKFFNLQSRVCLPTVLGRLTRMAESRDEVMGEMNVLYVACTRAKYRLHVMSSEEEEFNPHRAAHAATYSKMLYSGAFSKVITSPAAPPEEAAPVLIADSDGDASECFAAHFERQYAFEESIDLPVKSSASALLRAMGERPYPERELFTEEWEGTDRPSAERGTAYHRFLQLCDFNVKEEEQIAAEIARFVSGGLMEEEQAALLNAKSLSAILSMSCFSRISGEVWREREFLCSLPANTFLETSASDYVLVQGAIDLLCNDGGRCTIIDYKYSSLTPESLKAKYSEQLSLYRLAAGKILKIPPQEIAAYIVNIRTLKEVEL